MAIKASEHIWCNGNLIPWDDAKLHVMAHVINYGSSVFEGIRCYHTEKGPAVFRLRDHMQRLLDSAKVYRMETDYTLDEIWSRQPWTWSEPIRFLPATFGRSFSAGTAPSALTPPARRSTSTS